MNSWATSILPKIAETAIIFLDSKLYKELLWLLGRHISHMAGQTKQ